MNIVVIGGGPAGRTAAIEASEIGEDVILIEKDKIGGTCLNEGCMVVCGLNDVARFLTDAKNFSDLGIVAKDYEISFDQITHGIKKIIDKIREVLEVETKEVDVKIVYGDAKPEDNEVVVDGREYEYDKLIISTGSKPFIPPTIEGAQNAIIYKDILKLTKIPDEMVIIGGGVMAAEFAGIFSALGSKVDVLCDYNFLMMLDDDIKKHVVENFLDDVSIHENITVKRIHEAGVSTDRGEFEGLALLAAGMVPNSEIVDGIVDTGRRGEIIVNKRMETSHRGIYAAGDVTGGIGTTPVARMEGVVAARNACGISQEIDYRFIPHAISLYQDIGFISFGNSGEKDKDENKEDEETKKVVEGFIPGSAGPGSFWGVLDGKTGLTKTAVNIETGEIKKLFSVSPSARTTMAYMSFLLRDSYKTQDFDDFLETHPSTDAVYKLMRYFAKFL
ncbi:MAG: NAD(P)/FAD-dependent oxidoreductase [Euryarchaeota archaeon]|nr:NAD(P)/FAD-dependent oxidoreductase [Euryarchaeota archaeon]